MLRCTRLICWDSQSGIRILILDNDHSVGNTLSWLLKGLITAQVTVDSGYVVNLKGSGYDIVFARGKGTPLLYMPPNYSHRRAVRILKKGPTIPLPPSSVSAVSFKEYGEYQVICESQKQRCLADLASAVLRVEKVYENDFTLMFGVPFSDGSVRWPKISFSDLASRNSLQEPVAQDQIDPRRDQNQQHLSQTSSSQHFDFQQHNTSQQPSPLPQQSHDVDPRDVLAEARKNLQVLIDLGMSKELLNQLFDGHHVPELNLSAVPPTIDLTTSGPFGDQQAMDHFPDEHHVHLSPMKDAGPADSYPHDPNSTNTKSPHEYGSLQREAITNSPCSSTFDLTVQSHETRPSTVLTSLLHKPQIPKGVLGSLQTTKCQAEEKTKISSSHHEEEQNQWSPRKSEKGRAEFDTATTYSFDMLSDDPKFVYFQAFVDQLAEDVRAAADGTILQDVGQEFLDQALRDFAWKLHEESTNPFQLETSVIIHRKRR